MRAATLTKRRSGMAGSHLEDFITWLESRDVIPQRFIGTYVMMSMALLMRRSSKCSAKLSRQVLQKLLDSRVQIHHDRGSIAVQSGSD
jgi:hypothetical protein